MFRRVLLVAFAAAVVHAASGQTIAPPYSSSYTLLTFADVTGVPLSYCGIAFLDASTLLLGGNINTASAAIYKVSFNRDSNGHIVSFAGASLYASAPYLDCGLAVGPGGILFADDYFDNALLEYKHGSATPDQTISLAPLGLTSFVNTLQFVPAGFPGAGVLKITSGGGNWYDATLAQNASGTYDVSSLTLTVTTGTYPRGFVYVPPGSPQFSSPSVLVAYQLVDTVYAHAVDSGGNPTVAANVFMTATNQIIGAGIDPVTGDMLFCSYFGSLGTGGIVEVQGFAPSTLKATSGKLQSAMVKKAFGTPLTVLVSDPYGAPLSGATVNFAAPTSGASARLSAATAVTGSNGKASVRATANSTAGAYTVTATLFGRSVSFSLTNIGLSALTLSPKSVLGGSSTTGNTVTLTSAAPPSGAAIALTSSNPSVAAVPASVTVAGGSTVSLPFTITTTPVAASTRVTVKASDGAHSIPGTLTVRPASLVSVTLSPHTVLGGKSTTNNTVTLNGPAPAAGATVGLSSSDPTVAEVPPSVTVPPGANVSPAFTITTTAVATQTSVTMSAIYNGVTKTATLTVKPAQLASLKLSPATVKGGRSTTRNTVTLNGPAPLGSAVVMLTSGNLGVAAPPDTVTVAAGATTASFTIATTAVAADTVVPITATYGGVSKIANLTVTP